MPRRGVPGAQEALDNRALVARLAASPEALGGARRCWVRAQCLQRERRGPARAHSQRASRSCSAREGTRERSPPLRRARRPSEELRAQRAAHPRQSGQGRGSAWCTRGGPRPPVPGLLLLWVRESRRLHRWGAPSPSDSAGSRHRLRLGHPHCRPAGCILGGPHDHAQARCFPGVTQDSGKCPMAYH